MTTGDAVPDFTEGALVERCFPEDGWLLQLSFSAYFLLGFCLTNNEGGSEKASKLFPRLIFSLLN